MIFISISNTTAHARTCLAYRFADRGKMMGFFFSTQTDDFNSDSTARIEFWQNIPASSLRVRDIGRDRFLKLYLIDEINMFKILQILDNFNNIYSKCVSLKFKMWLYRCHLIYMLSENRDGCRLVSLELETVIFDKNPF